jgi:sigma-B regulation protein RsbU (phosphoserine phosphatase)
MTRIPRRVLRVLAAVFAAVTLLFSVLWMYYARANPSAELGIGFKYMPESRAMRITLVWENGPAARAGLREGDLVLAVNGNNLDRFANYFDAVPQGQPGDVVTLLVQRPGVDAPFTLTAVLGEYLSRLRARSWAETAALELINYYPLVFSVVGLVVLGLRLDDRNAWLLSLLFGGFIAGVPVLHLEGLIPPAMRGLAVAYKVALTALLPGVFCFFFAVFPAPSPLDQRVPRLKGILLGVSVALAAWLGGWALTSGGSQPLLELAGAVGAEWHFTVQGAILVPEPGSLGAKLAGTYFLGGMGLGLASLFSNAFRAASAEARRKARLVLWGTMVGITPLLLLYFAAISSRRPFYLYPFWIWAPTVLISFLFPLSFAYAVVKHRVLEIPVLLKRSVRYLIVRHGFLGLTLLVSAAITYKFVNWFSHALPVMRADMSLPIGMAVGVGFGILLTWAGTQAEKRFTERIDRAFFRSAYDARQILQELADRVRAVTSRDELASLLQQHIREALHPRTVAVYIEAGEDGILRPHGPAENLPTTLAADSPLLKELALHARPWELPPADEPIPPAYFSPVSLPQLANLRAFLEHDSPDSKGPQEIGDLLSVLVRSGGECLVPLVGRDSRLVGLLVLGQRLSEEPYSDEDERLLASVAGQAAVALENIRMGEKIATQLEAEHRNRQEIEIAREVQSKLFPQRKPALVTLDYAGECIQARTVGGDYYDFLDVGGRLALVLADVAGKGIGAALLMANLQANLRSQYAGALDDPPRLLRAVNALFFGSTFAERFATMFFAVYDDASRQLRYVNCGHNHPLVLRASGEALWLESSATVLGLFPDWDCTLVELQLAPGDTLIVYSDGVTEARSDDGEFFGDKRLLETVRAHSRLPVTEMMNAVVADVQRFSGSVQEDDLTVLVARVR